MEILLGLGHKMGILFFRVRAQDGDLLLLDQ
jgi:hypothetical protein